MEQHYGQAGKDLLRNHYAAVPNPIVEICKKN